MPDAPTTQAEQEDAVREVAFLRATVQTLSRELGIERRLVNDFEADVARITTERDQLAADLRKAREEDWSTDFAAASGLNEDILAGAYSNQGAWRQAVVGYAAEIFWDWPFGETPTHWRRLAKPPALTPDPNDAGGTAKGEDHGA